MKARIIQEAHFNRSGNPINKMGIGRVKILMDHTGKNYSEGGGYSFDNYGEENWRDIIQWLLEKGYSSVEVEAVMRSKLMRWSADHSNKDYGTNTLEDFQKFNTHWGKKTQVEDFLDKYIRGHEEEYKKDYNLNENMGGVGAPMATLGNVPGMGTAQPASMAATTAAQFNSPKSTGSGDKWGALGKTHQQIGFVPKKKKKKKKKIEEDNINPYDKLGTAMAKKMGVSPAFVKKVSKKNQNSMKQNVGVPKKKVSESIMPLEEFIKLQEKFKGN
jgi:hypothetical protein